MALIKTDKDLIQIKLYYLELKTDQDVNNIKIIDQRDGELMLKENERLKAEYLLKPQEVGENGVLKEKEVFKLKPERDVKILLTKWKTISWADSLEIESKSRKTNNDGEEIFDYLQNINQRYLMGLRDWNLQDDFGVKVPCTDENKVALPSSVVQKLRELYQKFINI